MNSRILALTVKAITGSTVRWVDCEPDIRQRIYFANHTSNLDTLVLWAALPRELRALVRPVAARDYWGANKIFNYLATDLFNAVLIDRYHVTRRNNALDLIIEAMGDRYSLILFPEGRRNPGPDIGQFKSGLYHLSKTKSDLDLVPVYLHNLNRILPKSEILPLPLLSSVTFGPPLRVKEDEAKATFLERARQAIRWLK